MATSNKDSRASRPKAQQIQFENSKLFPVIIEELQKGHTVKLNLRGISMRPFLEDRRDQALLTKLNDPKVGDPVLAEVGPGHYVLHRIIKMEGENVTLMGDGNLRPEYCTKADLRASVIGFYRKGRQTIDRTDGWKWRIYSWIWMRITPPIRRWPLAFHRRIWLKIFKPKRI